MKPESRSIADIVLDLKKDLTVLVREEVNLARVELMEKTRRLRRGALSFGLGGVVVFSGFLSLVAAAILLLDRVIGELWLSSVIIGVDLLAIGALLLGSARKQLADLAPRETADSLRRSKELFERHVTGEPAGRSS